MAKALDFMVEQMQTLIFPSSLLWIADAILLAKDLRRMRSTN
jgi:hypothetical protein